MKMPQKDLTYPLYIKIFTQTILNSIKIKAYKEIMGYPTCSDCAILQICDLDLKAFKKIHYYVIFFHYTLMIFCAQFLSCQLLRDRYNQGTWINKMTGK